MLPTPTIRFSLDRKRRSYKQSQKKMETLWFFRLRSRRACDSAYDSDFWFSKGHKRSHDSAYDSDSDFAASLNQPLIAVKTLKSVRTPTEIRLPSKQRFLSRMAFSIYEVVLVACQSQVDRPLSRLFEAGMKEAVIFLLVRSHKPNIWEDVEDILVATRVDRLAREVKTSRAQFCHRSASTAQSLSCSLHLTFQFSSSSYKFDLRPWCAYNAFSFFSVHRWVTKLNKLRSFQIQKLGCELY